MLYNLHPNFHLSARSEGLEPCWRSSHNSSTLGGCACDTTRVHDQHACGWHRPQTGYIQTGCSALRQCFHTPFCGSQASGEASVPQRLAKEWQVSTARVHERFICAGAVPQECLPRGSVPDVASNHRLHISLYADSVLCYITIGDMEGNPPYRKGGLDKQRISSAFILLFLFLHCLDERSSYGLSSRWQACGYL